MQPVLKFSTLCCKQPCSITDAVMLHVMQVCQINRNGHFGKKLCFTYLAIGPMSILEECMFTSLSSCCRVASLMRINEQRLPNLTSPKSLLRLDNSYFRAPNMKFSLWNTSLLPVYYKFWDFPAGGKGVSREISKNKNENNFLPTGFVSVHNVYLLFLVFNTPTQFGNLGMILDWSCWFYKIAWVAKSRAKYLCIFYDHECFIHCHDLWFYFVMQLTINK